jgi:hypothetical protein
MEACVSTATGQQTIVTETKQLKAAKNAKTEGEHAV